MGDFGLPEGVRPLAWLPPEIICAHHVTPKQTCEGDIWLVFAPPPLLIINTRMFGVFMWECLTLGATPHYQRSLEDIQAKLRLPDRGLDCPNSCPLDVYVFSFLVQHASDGQPCWNASLIGLTEDLGQSERTQITIPWSIVSGPFETIMLPQLFGYMSRKIFRVVSVRNTDAGVQAL